MTSTHNNLLFCPVTVIIGTKWWSTNTPNPFIQIDLGVSKSICKVSIAWADGSSHQYSFNISVYTEGTGTTWLPVFSGATIGNTTSAETYTFPPTQGRYVKMIITQSTAGSTSSVAQISEIDAFGP